MSLLLSLCYCHCHYVIVTMSLSLCLCHYVIVTMSLSLCHCHCHRQWYWHWHHNCQWVWQWRLQYIINVLITCMYLDTWSNYPVNQSVDIWAAGCVLFCICYNKHPFEVSNSQGFTEGGSAFTTVCNLRVTGLL